MSVYYKKRRRDHSLVVQVPFRANEVSTAPRQTAPGLFLAPFFYANGASIALLANGRWRTQPAIDTLCAAVDIRLPWSRNSTEYLIGAPSCTLDAFKIPRLRQCLFDLDSMTWEAQIDGGLDGYLWKVKFGDQGPFALKVFWDTEPLPYDSMTYHPVQRECHNVALLEMMQESIAQATPESPILVNANPTTREDAWANQVAFS
ncbi:hypothetical protein TrVFT333_002175 [Trichoderma virens FT-333]|nr:hypothetical protein TrVFT333_002175 [Trichoderma virens FT-333]